MVIQIWDLPLRLFHWLLMLSVMFSYITGKLNGLWLDWHIYSGEFIFGLIIFRILWGFWGNTYARFTNFFPTPKRLKIFIAEKWHSPGHSPIGALSVIVMLVGLLGQTVLGFFSMNDEIETSGPLNSLVSSELSEQMTNWHTSLSTTLLFFIGLHLIAIFYYIILKGEIILKPMITGEIQITGKMKLIPDKGGGIKLFSITTIIAIFTVWFLESDTLHQWLRSSELNLLKKELQDW